MDYVVTQTKQIALIAETPEEAQQKALNGEGKTISSTLKADPRPQPSVARPQLPSVLTNMKTGLPVQG